MTNDLFRDLVETPRAGNSAYPCTDQAHVVFYTGSSSAHPPLNSARCSCGAYTWWELSKMLKPTPADHEWARQVLEEMGEL